MLTYLGEIGDVVDWVESVASDENTVHRNTGAELDLHTERWGCHGAWS